MVFATETEVESSSDTAPLSPEQVANAEAKNALLNESLGIEKDIDPTSGDETDDDEESPSFSALDLERVAIKNALLESDIEQATTNGVEPIQPLKIEFVVPPGLQTETADEDEEVHMLVPPEVAEYLRKGGYKIVLQPIDDSHDAQTDTVGADDGAKTPCATESLPDESTRAHRSNDASETEDGQSSESESASSRAKKGGLGSAHRGGKIGN
jgi:hypothetical protein